MEAIAKIILFGEHSVVYGKRALACLLYTSDAADE